MGEDNKCCCEEKHQVHICVLRCKEKTSEVERMTNTPNVICFNCGEGANSKDNVCSPVQLFV